ncbi:MAG: hypothetical protein R3B37_11315 [Nitrospira sp.]|nr:hypothetical protein [Nitrospira sp.]
MEIIVMDASSDGTDNMVRRISADFYGALTDNFGLIVKRNRAANLASTPLFSL